MSDLKDSLVNYGMWILSKQLRKDSSKHDGSFVNNENIEKARKIIGDPSSKPDYFPKLERLKTIFSFVQPHDSEVCHASNFSLKQLSIKLDSDKDDDIDQLWKEFSNEAERIPKGAGRFETFYNLYKKYAWYIPGTLNMDGISLFEQFKAVTAISHCLEKGTEELLLVGGDLPGIQSMLYTITSKGAAKSLRGRSFYLQILCDILVHSVIRELSLSSANIIYSAGGNFKMLASAQDKETLQSLRREINSRLLDAHRGDLFVAMDWVELNIDDVVNENFSRKVTDLVQNIAKQKRTWFAEHASNRYNDIFGIQGKGGPTGSELEAKNYCEVCHVEVDKNTRDFDLDERTTKCDQCKSFEDLSPILRRSFFIVESRKKSIMEAKPINEKYRTSSFGKPSWDDIMESLGYKCMFENDTSKLDKNKRLSIYKTNSCDFLPETIEDNWDYGFRFIGNTTPTMDEKSVKDMLEKYGESHNQEEIRNTNVMADLDATGIKRYGILRMDVDWLGKAFSDRLTKKDILHTSALSASLSLFFNGWLNCICGSMAQDWKEEISKIVGEPNESTKSKLPYIIYSGGDDLFIVGSWDVMPILAERIRNDFVSYVTKGYVSNEQIESTPCMTISAGISIFTTKFPIYQAAELAKDALDDKAKGRKIKQGNEEKEVKDAINFLDVTVGWEDFEAVKNMAFELSKMIKPEKNEDKSKDVPSVPRSFLTLLKQIADTYTEDAKKNESGIVYGKWMWQLAYSLQSMKERTKSPELKQQIMKIGGSIHDLGTVNGSANWKMIKYLDLPVRWAEFLIRGGQ
jgi:CRISPR-associated protein Csm1